MRWIIYDGDVDAVCHCVEINASPRSSERPKLGHDLREIDIEWSTSLRPQQTPS